MRLCYSMARMNSIFGKKISKKKTKNKNLMIYDDLHTRLGFRRVNFVKIKTFVGVIFLNLEYLLIFEIYLLFYPQTIETKT